LKIKEDHGWATVIVSLELKCKDANESDKTIIIDRQRWPVSKTSGLWKVVDAPNTKSAGLQWLK